MPTADATGGCVDGPETVALLDRSPRAASDHVVEASVQGPSGRIAILGCTHHLPDAARFEVPKSLVRVRASHANPANVRRPGSTACAALPHRGRLPAPYR
ncbi:hypothetical protein [Streptomyces sp. NPDC056154]|uniref:hypothetical protein n=1 Tax=unclassified Streptomyces TaxID=2593676 RepID=UPI0035DA9F43